MKMTVSIAVLAFLFSTTASLAQDIPQNQVPSLVLNSFQQSYSKAFDVEWELDGEKYMVEFELGLPGTDHEIWYDRSGKLLRHKEEISKGDLPRAVQIKLKTNYSSYRIDDVKKITEGAVATYTLEVKNLTEEWKLALDTEGNELSRIAD
jgi:hypothetical protein